MTQNALQLYVRSQIDGLPTPFTQPVQASVSPPDIQDVSTNPLCFIWLPDANEKRLAFPRGGGRREGTDVLAISVVYDLAQDTDNADQVFACVLDAIKAKLRGLVLPVALSDPTTNETSSLESIGEEIQTQQAVPRYAGGGVQSYRWSALLRATVREIFIG